MSNTFDGNCLNDDEDDGDDDDDYVGGDVPDDGVARGCLVQRWRVAFCFGSGEARGRRCASDAASPLLA